MNKFYLYKLISDCDNEAAHIYEHLFLRAAQQALVEAGFAPGLYGWQNGATYRDIILLECGFYDPKATKIFAEFLQQPVEFDPANIAQAVAVISAEYRGQLTYDPAVLAAELARIAARPFFDLEKTPILTRFSREKARAGSKIVQVKSQKDHYHKIALNFAYRQNNLEEIALLFRLWPILYDQLATLINQLGGYIVNVHAPSFNPQSDWLTMGVEVGFKKGLVSKPILLQKIKRLQRDFDFAQHRQALQTYAREFRDNIDFAHIPEEIFERTGALVSRQKIAALLTPENAERVWQQLRCDISTT